MRFLSVSISFKSVYRLGSNLSLRSSLSLLFIADCKIMAFFKSTMPICPHHCSQWARVYMKYCLCSMKDGVSLTLGMISVFSWGVAEVPQIVTNYKKKSTEGLSLAFLLTWIIGWEICSILWKCWILALCLF